MHKKSYKADLIEEVFTHYFQAAKFKVQVDGCNITLLAIYHPSYSTVNPVTEIMFIDDFTKWICDQLIMSKHGHKLFILGNFNIHMNDKFDDNAGNFMDIIMVLGLKQHIHFPTHKAGNTLDLVITKLGSKLEVTKCSPDPFVWITMLQISWLSYPCTVLFKKLTQYKLGNCVSWIMKSL